MDKKTVVTLEIWRLRSLRNVKAHYKAAEIARLWDEVYTGVNVTASVFMVALGVAISFSNLKWPLKFGSVEINGLVIPLCFFSTAFLITTLLQYFFVPGVRAATHKRAGADYAAVNRRIEEIVSNNSEFDISIFQDIRHSLDKLGVVSPLVNEKIYNLRKDIGDEILGLECKLATLMLHDESEELGGGSSHAERRTSDPKLVA